MQKQFYKIAAIIVSFNGEKWLEKCLSSFEKSNYAVDIFVFDNASSDQSAEIAKKFQPKFLNASKENLGFGAANNFLLKEAYKQGYDYFFLLNQDAYIFPDTIENLLKTFEKFPNFGIVSPLHFQGNQKELDTNFGEYYSKSKKIDENNRKANFVNAAAWMLSRKTLETVGLFHPHFKHYGEDKEYCNRCRFFGLDILINEQSKIVHDRSQTHTFEKFVRLSEIKLETIALNINYSVTKSIGLLFINAVGITKYHFKKSRKAIKSIQLFISLLTKAFAILSRWRYFAEQRVWAQSEKRKKLLKS